MAKFYGGLGFITTEERIDMVNGEAVHTGIYQRAESVRECYGDILKNIRRFEKLDAGSNEDINISNTFSVICDPYAFENLEHLRYLLWNSNKWKITSYDIEYPRLNLTVGGVWND